MNDAEILEKYYNLERTANAPHLPMESKIHSLLNKSTKKMLVSERKDSYPEFFWDEQRFNLYKSSLFRGLNQEKRNIILKTLSNHSLMTSYYIEKSAICLSSKLVSLSESIEEKAMYTMIGAEEVYHWLEFQNFINFVPEQYPNNSLLIKSIGDLTQKCDKLTSIYVGQVFLEGFGMHFYRSLGESCLDKDLSLVFDRIIEDEARHHGTALVIFNRDSGKLEKNNELIDRLSSLIKILLNHHLHLLNVIETVTGELSIQERIKIMDEIDAEKQMESRAQKIKQMFTKSGEQEIINLLDESQAFKVSLDYS